MRYLKFKKGFLLGALSVLFILTGCSIKEKEKNTPYSNISPEEAKRIMDEEQDYIILDVRTEEEYRQGHIKNAILIPDFEIAEIAKEKLPNQEQLILVYCRSGRRSKGAAEQLVALGYTNIKEFGGIIDWTYEIEE